MRGKKPGVLSPSLCKSPDAQPGQTEGDAGDAEFATPHAEHGLLGQDLGLVFLELGSARKIAVGSESQERSAT